jgi:signal transduction histidine kinase
LDLRTQSAFIVAVLSLTIALSVLLRTRKERLQNLFVVFCLSMAAFYLSSFFQRWLGGGFWARAALVTAVILPQGSIRFFREFLGPEARAIRLYRVAIVLGVVALGLVLSPLYRHDAVETLVGAYVFGLLGASLVLLQLRARSVESRADRARVLSLVIGGAIALTFSALDYLLALGVAMPPIGNVLTLIFLYFLSQTLLRRRLLDLFELIGRLAVLTAMSVTLALIFFLLVEWIGGSAPFFLNAIIASLVILILFDPLRAKVEGQIADLFFRERYELERHVMATRARLAHVLEVDEVGRVLLSGIEASHRATHAAIYLIDPQRRGYDLLGHLGPRPPERLESASVRPLIDRLRREPAVLLEDVEAALADSRGQKGERTAGTFHEVVRTMETLHASLCLAVRAEAGFLGLVTLRDERLRDAYTAEDVELLKGLASQVAVAVQNSKLYERMKERDRLAALGEMAAGLAHEIRNPLGAIKAAAQYLETPPAESDVPKEFLGIIVEETNRLNRVVSSFLDYARPYKGNPVPTDVRGVAERTLQVMQPSLGAGVDLVTEFQENLPFVRIDPEQLRQVIMNLVQNAVQAMESKGRLTVSTGLRATPIRSDPGEPASFVEMRVTDTGPGIAQKAMGKLFIPFFTTKDRGTGLGLAICQRIVQTAGGAIEVRTLGGEGTTFTVLLPALDVGGGEGTTLESDRPSELPRLDQTPGLVKAS